MESLAYEHGNNVDLARKQVVEYRMAVDPTMRYDAESQSLKRAGVNTFHRRF